MRDKFSSVQRRLLTEQGEELELDIPAEPKKGTGKESLKDMPIEGGEEGYEFDIPKDEEEPELPEGDEGEVEGEGEAEAAATEPPIEDEEAGIEEEEPEELGEETAEKTNLLTQAIDDLDKTRSDINKKGLLLAMHMSDFSTQRRLQALADELGNIVNHLQSKMLKTVSKSPMDLKKATDWLSGTKADEIEA